MLANIGFQKQIFLFLCQFFPKHVHTPGNSASQWPFFWDGEFTLLNEKKGPWLVRLYIGDGILPSYIPGLFHNPRHPNTWWGSMFEPPFTHISWGGSAIKTSKLTPILTRVWLEDFGCLGHYITPKHVVYVGYKTRVLSHGYPTFPVDCIPS